MQTVILLLGVLSVVYGTYAYLKGEIISSNIPKYLPDWWKRPIIVTKGRRARFWASVVVVLGIVIILNYFLISSGVVTYP